MSATQEFLSQFSEEELAALPADVQVFHVEQLAVPGLDAERCIVWMRPAVQGGQGGMVA